ncbi:MAG: hypothetical protein LBH41_02575, partial [Rickettsiales bacterium]|nr:hypothetical protein [Rickettsiales bacterium]
MPKQSISITTLSRGEASPDLAGRADFDAYRKSALRIYNMRPIATGGIARRDGLKFDADAAGARLAIPFEASDGTSHLFLLSPLSIEAVDTGGARRASLASSFGADDIAMVRWAQKGDETHLVCATKPPCRIAYTPHLKAFTISGWEFAKRAGGDFSTRPFARFPATSGVRLRPSAASGTATIEADSPIFAPGHIGSLLSINGGQALVSSVAGNRMSATAQVKHPLSSAGEWTDDWREQAFSTARGWPASITFHQNRMVIGGSRDLPNRIWLSKTAEHDNFDLGDGLDDEAIEFDILSDKGHRISSVFSGKHLLVFTSEGEFMVGGAPMTPTSVSIREQTGIGSPAERNIPPRFVEGSVIFTARNGREVREFVYGEIEGGYESRDLAALSSHLLVRPAWQEYDKAERILYIINEDGTCACLSLNKALDFEAWFQYETDGKFVSAAFAGGKMFFIVERGGACLLEHLDKDATADSCACADTESFALSIGGLGHLEGREV